MITPTLELIYQLEHREAYAPIRATDVALGWDLRTPYCFNILPHSSDKVDLGLRIHLPELPAPYNQFMHIGAFVWSKSGLSVKKDIETGAGVIDPDFTGILQVKLHNFSEKTVEFNRGDKVAQLVLQICPIISGAKEGNVDSLEKERGDRGFGSSGR